MNLAAPGQQPCGVGIIVPISHSRSPRHRTHAGWSKEPAHNHRAPEATRRCLCTQDGGRRSSEWHS